MIMNTRLMREEDAPAVARLSGELGYPLADEEARHRIHFLRDLPDQTAWVAEMAGGVVVGWIQVRRCFTLAYGPRAEIVGLVVSAESRGQGIGKILVAQAEAWAAARGFPAVGVSSRVAREAAHVFYEGLGYERQKTSHVFLKKLNASTNL